MHKINGAVLMLALCLSFVCCSPSYADSANSAAGHRQNSLLGNDADAAGSTEVDGKDYGKRVERYGFGLGRRAYMYTNGGTGMKRLPVYNFGLGKRARPYSFGLGKRMGVIDYDDEHEYGNNDYDGYNGGIAAGAAAPYMSDEKRNRPYSFGLGKRDSDDVERRGYPNRYGFGLGRR